MPNGLHLIANAITAICSLILIVSLWRRIARRGDFWADQYYSFGRRDLDRNPFITFKRMRDHRLPIILQEFKAFYASSLGKAVCFLAAVSLFL
ncbi:hypothetical protein SAMN04515648_0091 [Phyllobacterium sp. CL33Tsu]|nr:hypothetical protein SAMN04515648_0091 [Phyllobacterium sp. CL33Tsu]